MFLSPFLVSTFSNACSKACARRVLCALLFPIALGVPAFAPPCAQAQAPAHAQKTDVRMGLVLEPPGLDPTTGAAAAIGEIVFDTVFESLTHITGDGGVEPMLADSWDVSADGKTYVFHLHRGSVFHNGIELSAKDVIYSFTRARAAGSTNKDKDFFANISAMHATDDATLTINFAQAEAKTLFHFGLPTAAIVEETSAPHNDTNPIGTGPYRFVSWERGGRVILERAPTYHGSRAPQITHIAYSFISDPTAETTAMLAGNLDAFPRFAALESLPVFRKDPRFQVLLGGTEGKTILAMNNARAPLNNILVRRAIAAAIDKQAVIDAAVDGYGIPISSHMTPMDEGYVDVSSLNPFDPERSRRLLVQAGVTTPLTLSLKLPPPAYARRGGELIAAELAQIGISVHIENMEWAQWLATVYGGAHDFDLTIISHVEPLDLGIYAQPAYYFGYDSAAFRNLYARIRAATDENTRLALLAEAQTMLARDCVNVFLFQLPQITVANAHLKGLWRNAPIFVNDVANWRWEE